MPGIRKIRPNGKAYVTALLDVELPKHRPKLFLFVRNSCICENYDDPTRYWKSRENAEDFGKVLNAVG